MEKTIEQTNDVRINAQILLTYTHKNITSHNETISHCTIEMFKKNNHFPKNFSISLQLANSASLTLVVNIAIINRLHTRIANTVKNGDIEDQ